MRRYVPALKRILAEHLLIEAPHEEDTQRNTDLIVLGFRDIRVACRVRSFAYVQRYPNDVAIRSERPNGVRTELAKIVMGWGTHLLYGFGAATGDDLCAWVLGDLDAFRLWLHEEILRRGRMPGIERRSPDGSSRFRAFDLAELPERFVVARQGFEA